MPQLNEGVRLITTLQCVVLQSTLVLHLNISTVSVLLSVNSCSKPRKMPKIIIDDEGPNVQKVSLFSGFSGTVELDRVKYHTNDGLIVYGTIKELCIHFSNQRHKATSGDQTASGKYSDVNWLDVNYSDVDPWIMKPSMRDQSRVSCRLP